MRKIITGICLLFVFALVGETQAQNFRSYQTTTEEISYNTRVLDDGRTIVQVVVSTIVVDLTPNPVTAESTVSTNTKTQTLFLTSAAATDLKAAIAAAGSGDSVISQTVDSEIEDSDKIKDTSGNNLTSITYVEIVNGVPTFTPVTGGIVETNDVVTTERLEFTTIVEQVKAIVTPN